MKHITEDPSSIPFQNLMIRGVMDSHGRRIVLWDEYSRQIIAHAKIVLEHALLPVISPLCMHINGRGGAKGCIRDVQKQLPNYPFVARFDVASYYDTIDHTILLTQFEQTETPVHCIVLVRQYLATPDLSQSGIGLTAGGSISPLLGALYLKPLDDALSNIDGIFYRRFMDDFVILATTRRKLRKGIRLVHGILTDLNMCVHEKKRFIGRTSSGFDFLGYHVHPFRRLRPSAESLRRFMDRSRRLYEQGASLEKLWQYVKKWCQWLWGGVYGKVSRKGGIRKYWIWIAKALNIEKDTYLSSKIGR